MRPKAAEAGGPHPAHTCATLMCVNSHTCTLTCAHTTYKQPTYLLKSFVKKINFSRPSAIYTSRDFMSSFGNLTSYLSSLFSFTVLEGTQTAGLLSTCCISLCESQFCVSPTLCYWYKSFCHFSTDLIFQAFKSLNSSDDLQIRDAQIGHWCLLETKHYVQSPAV